MFKRRTVPLRSGLRSLKFGSRLSMMEPSIMAAARTPKPPLSSRAVRITKDVAICNCCAVEAAYSLGTTTLSCHALICLERLESSTLQIPWSYDPSVAFTRPIFWSYLWHSQLSSTMIKSFKKWIYHDLSWICLQSVKDLSKLRAPKYLYIMPLVFCIQGATKKRPPTSKNTAASVTSAPDGRPGICSCPRGIVNRIHREGGCNMVQCQLIRLEITKWKNSVIKRRFTHICHASSLFCWFSNFVVRCMYLWFLCDGILWPS